MSKAGGKRWILGIAGVLAGILVIAGIYFWMTRAFNEKIEPGVAPVAHAQVPEGAVVAPVEWVATELVGQAIGTVRAKHQTVIASSRLSRVEKVHVRAGDTVKDGQLLIELDQRELIAKKAAAMAALQAAKADLELKRPAIRAREATIG